MARAKARRRKPKAPPAEPVEQTGASMVSEPVATYGSAEVAEEATHRPDLGEHEEELNRLVSFIDLADGFALAFAECNFDHLRDVIIEEARWRCAGNRCSLTWLAAASPPPGS